MEICKTMQSEITKIANKHGFDMTASQAHLRLQNPPYMDLVIEKIGRAKISVCHYVEINGDLCQDPEVCFFIDPLGWVPYEITQMPVYIAGITMGGYRICAEFDDTGTRITGIKKRAMKEIAEFARSWSKNIQQQGYLERGVKDSPQ